MAINTPKQNADKRDQAVGQKQQQSNQSITRVVDSSKGKVKKILEK